MDFLNHTTPNPNPDPVVEWPAACFEKYERLHAIGKGSFGQVWMSRRKTPAKDEFDDEYVAIKAIQIKNEKSEIYAEREIRILQELRHPNVIRLIQDFPVFHGIRVVVMQLARGPNLHNLVVRRGALGLPLCRMVARHLIAAVGYIHGRGVIHRDVKPANCILALTKEPEPASETGYDWYADNAIWSSKEDAVHAVHNNKWKLMLVDFGFARALEKEEIDAQPKKLRNSIALESSAGSNNSSNGIKDEVNRSATSTYKIRMINDTILENGGDGDDEDSIAADMAALENIVASAAEGIRKSVFEPTNAEEAAIMGVPQGVSRTRHSAISMPLSDEDLVNSNSNRRVSSARRNVRSMSALGTKAYAAPEIRKQLRNKTEADFEKANAAMTECVADYGMIVDAYSVGWTLRVAMTGVPPNFTMSEYMEERDNAVLGDEEDGEIIADQCCCFSPIEIPIVRIRDPSMLPPAATLMLTRMTEKNPEERMTVREAQNDPYILPSEEEKGNIWVLPVGDVPSKHGDPVVPLKCAYDLSQMTVSYHGR